jgi:hypothetical protein
LPSATRSAERLLIALLRRALRSEVGIRLAVEAAMISGRVLLAAAAKLDIRRLNARWWLPGSNG